VRDPQLVQPTHSSLGKNTQMKIQQWLMLLRTELNPEKKRLFSLSALFNVTKSLFRNAVKQPCGIKLVSE